MRQRKPNLIIDKSFEFSLKIIDLYKDLTINKKEYVLSKQILRSGTSVCANAREAVVSQSRKEFISKLNISLKEAHETEYWLELLIYGKYLEENTPLLSDIDSIIRILTSIIKSSNENNPTSYILNPK